MPLICALLQVFGYMLLQLHIDVDLLYGYSPTVISTDFCQLSYISHSWTQAEKQDINLTIN